MAKDKKSPSFQFYAQDFLTGVMYLTNEEIGMYIKMLAKQWTDGKIPKKRLGLFLGIEWDSLSEELKNKFTDCGEHVINKRLEIEREKKKNFLKKQSDNGKKGGRPPKSNNNKKPNESQKNPLEEEDEDEKEKEFDKEKEIISIFNSTCVNLPQVQKLTDKRKKQINAREKEYDLESIGLVFQKASESKFLNGKNKEGWTASFDWIMNTNNFLKILEDNYKNGKEVNNNGADQAFRNKTAERLGIVLP